MSRLRINTERTSAAEIPRKRPDRGPDRGGNRHRSESSQERELATVEQA